jgi:hypothetical protein
VHLIPDFIMTIASKQAGAALAASILAIGLSGCATVLESNQQELMVQAIENNQELIGVGCVLSNPAGRWYVLAPGKVMVQKSTGDLQVDCKKDGGSAGTDSVASKLNNTGLWGNIVVTAGIGYFVDKRTGAGFDYPSTLTVIMRSAPAPAAQPVPSGSVLY